MELKESVSWGVVRGSLGIVKGSGRERQEGHSFSVAAVKTVTLEVSGYVIASRQLQSILVHAPAEPTFPALGWFALGRERR